ncbi:MAG: hypothetical protein IJ071_00345 [Ruminococcus sp.]|nr:hypothetical protein [Ruminococcus sp.]
MKLECLQPCLRAVGFLTKYLRGEAIFLSATMPDHSALFQRYIGDAKCRELILDKQDTRFFQKCRYSYLGMTDMEAVAQRALDYPSSLIIVNSRKTAREIYRLLTGRKYHLSTYMTPFDRSETIPKIRRDLADGEKITVVSTSLVEAGVDLYFQAVFRQLAGLGSILQSGGRCNREGRLDHGDVFIFETEDKLRGDMKVRAAIVRDLLDRGCELTSEESIKEYYSRLFAYSDELIEQNSISAGVDRLDGIPFRSYAEGFGFIKDETVSVVIESCGEAAQLVEQLPFGGKTVRRKLQRYSVSLRVHGELDRALKAGLLRETDSGFFILSAGDRYNSETGLDIDYQPDYID